MAYKHVIRAKTKNLFNVNSEWEGVLASLTNINLSVEGNTISGTELRQGASSIISPTKIPISTNKVYYTSGQCSGDPTILVRLTDESGEVLTTGVAETLHPYNQYYKAFIVYLNTTFSITNDNAKYLQLGLRFGKGASTSTRVTFTNVQFEEGSTPTPYTPYNYLQSNKRMIKVSDVCQLIDKNKVASINTAGVTYTNNGDGTWTVNGTSTGPAWSGNLIPDSKSYNLFGHKLLLMVACDDDNIVMEFKYVRKDGTGYGFNYYKEHIYTFTEIENYDSFQVRLITLKTGVTFTNTQATPQLFDLTEMFGAGHEPATVAEFRQRFPNELYPYSPQCWLTSYKSAVVCKTKNLFDVNNAAPYTFGTDNYDSNLVWLKDGIYTTRMNNYNLGSGLRIKNGLTLPAGVYTLSVKVVDCTDFGTGGYANIGFYYKIADGTWHVLNGPRYSYAPGTTLSFAINIPEHIELRLYLNYQNMNGQFLAGYISYKDIQLEQGSTATSYVPYQHL